LLTAKNKIKWRVAEIQALCYMRVKGNGDDDDDRFLSNHTPTIAVGINGFFKEFFLL
jgi:hypothetical protein